MAKVTPDNLNDVMEFEHVVTVTRDGRVLDGPDNLYAPDVLDDEIQSEGWEFLDGYSGQYGYSGPIMHSSEFIGGGMARDILATPGVYVAVVAMYSPDEDDDDGSDYGAEGWAVLRYAPADAHECDCGHPAVVRRYGSRMSTPGYATDRDGRTLCYLCADDAQRREMATAPAALAYVASDGRSLTTWTGGRLARVTAHSVARNGWHGSEVHRWWAESPDGARWYGSNGGHGLAVTVRRLVG